MKETLDAVKSIAVHRVAVNDSLKMIHINDTCGKRSILVQPTNSKKKANYGPASDFSQSIPHY